MGCSQSELRDWADWGYVAGCFRGARRSMVLGMRRDYVDLGVVMRLHHKTTPATKCVRVVPRTSDLVNALSFGD